MARTKKIPVMDSWGYPMMHLLDPAFAKSGDDDLTRSNPPRDRFSHPYSYDPFTTWGGKNTKCNGSVYTDRMSGWDYKKFDACYKKHLNGKGFGERCDGQAVQAFLRDYFEDQTVELTRVIEYCNASTGYPVWRLDYYQKPQNA